MLRGVGPDSLEGLTRADVVLGRDDARRLVHFDAEFFAVAIHGSNFSNLRIAEAIGIVGALGFRPDRTFVR